MSTTPRNLRRRSPAFLARTPARLARAIGTSPGPRAGLGGLALWCLLTTAGLPVRAAEYVAARDISTGGVRSLSLEGYRPLAGATKSALSVAEVTAVAGAFVTDHAGTLGVSAASGDLLPLAPWTDKLGLGHQRFAIRHQGVPVYGAEVLVHVDPGAGVYLASVKPMGTAPATVSPGLTAAAARDVALAWAATTAPAGCKVEATEPALAILPMRLTAAPSEDARLMWRVVVREPASPPRFDQDVFVDAADGHILRATSRIRGDIPLSRGVVDCACPNAPYPTGCLNAYRSGYWWGRGEGQPPRGPCPAIAGVPALFHGRRDTDDTYDLIQVIDSYLLNDFGLDGANGTGGLSMPGWGLGTNAWRVFTLYDADDAVAPTGHAQFYTSGEIALGAGMVTEDVLGHEVGHCVLFIHFTDESGFPIGSDYWGETGALEECFSDVFGESVEAELNGICDWRPGATSAFGVARDLTEPGNVTYYDDEGILQPYPAHFHAASVYCGSYDFAGVHLNATIPGHAFYLMAEGGSWNRCAVGAVGLDVAKHVFHRAWTTYFTTTTTFNEGYAAILQAAADLYGPEVVAQVRAALQAVELDQPGRCSGLPEEEPACARMSAVPVDPVSPAADSSIRSCGPNPSYGPAAIEYALARPGQVEVTVHDAAGRRVAVLVSQWQERGLHRAEWAGRKAASGIYFVRVAVAGQAVGTGKLLVIR